MITQAQTDNFDSYVTIGGFTNEDWVLSEMVSGLTTTTFPAVGTGKGLRIQANPVPGFAPAVAIWYRTTEYTNFHLAADLVNWADTNQAVALLARGRIVDDPGGASSYLVNYNVTEWGDAPGSPRQGELQISVLTPPFSTVQLALAALTLDPASSYRIIFTGVGFHFRVQVYDLQDLTRPLIQMEADDLNHAYTNGICGLMTYSRDDEPHSATSDVTLDNYQIGEFDANPATAPALAHPVPGTPTVETRSPDERFQHGYQPGDGISFTAKTYSTDVIDASATRLRLNGVDVSSQLWVSASGAHVSGILPGSALTANAVYNAQLEVQDLTGAKRSTNTFWFDTFSESFLGSSEVKIIEAEEYNYSNGVYQLDPIPVSGLNLGGFHVAGNGVGYYDLRGVEGVDFHDSLGSAEPLWAAEFRQFDPVGLAQGMYPEREDAIDPFGETRYSDAVRGKYVTNNMLEIVVHRAEPGEWLNYTRAFNPGRYRVWLRVASLGDSEVWLDRVTGNPTLPGQSTVNLGRFSIPNQFTRYHYRYIPLTDNFGSPVILNLWGTNTLRLTIAGIPGADDDKLAINYILFAPVPFAVRLLSAPTFNGLYTEELGAVMDASSRTITVPVAGSARFYRLSAEMALTINKLSISNGIVTIQY